ncbi:Rne/Rng family ribonuclease [Bifidobacterium simiarum]|uniref:Ribonuclease E n=1 Tax=Bifidobacterium simiarum TaxID=2045441 RepID=A0A2M9HCT6_9BIFI|nr:Rne/Rng family ribonuclease [Bifidobacterium simiarum]PJM74620.1 ribonuclease E/G [Bifidobacterium simiarum]
MEAVAAVDASTTAGAQSTVSDSAAAAAPVAEPAASSADQAPASAGAEEAPKPAPRRRGGRRVVRAAAAAGAKVPVKIEAVAGARARRKAAAAAVESALAELPRVKDAGESHELTESEREARASLANLVSVTAAARHRKADAVADRADHDDVADAAAPAENRSAESPVRTRRRSRTAGANGADVAATDDVAASASGRSTSRRSSRSASAKSSSAKSTSAKSSARAAADEARRGRIAALADELFTDKGIDADRPAARPSRRSGDAPLEFSSPEQEIPALPARPRPMTSLLFQEPVLPSVRPAQPAESADGSDDDVRADHTDRDDRDRTDRDRAERSDRDRADRSDRSDRSDEGQTVRRRRRRRADRDPRDEQETRESTAASRDGHDSRKDDARSADVERDGREESGEGEHEGESRRSRRSRRLNAQERRAAAEVEQIEQDLEYDDIHYTPIDVENDDEDDHDASSGETRSRRRRRRSSGSDEGEHEGESRRSRREREHEDDDEGTVTRRRRRRRNKGEDAREEPTIRRSRKQQYIDEITDIEGSTRLEAKKQRRRDNRRDRSRQSTLLEQDFLARRENVNRLMVVREKERHTQISVIEDSILVEHYVSDIQEVSTVGNIYLGRVQNVLPSMEAAFVDIGQPRNGVLYAGEVNWDTTRLEGQPRRIELAFRSGDPVLVQVTKDPIGHKGARLTSQVTLAGRFLVLVPSGGMTGVSRKLPERERTRLKTIVSKIAPAEMGVIIRTAAEGASKEAIEKDLESLTKQWEHVKEAEAKARNSKRPKLLQGEPDVAIRVVRDIFNDDFNKLVVEGDKVYDRIEEYLDTMAPDLKDKLEKWDPEEHQGKDVFDQWRIDSQLRKGMERKVYLPSGGSLVIDRTEAMTTIDVNTGRFIGKGKSLEETVTRCNLEAAEEIARQLRLRDIGGMVMIDFVDMVLPANRDLVLRRLVECLARDRTKHQVAEVTSLGLVQMTRKRVGQGLVEAFSEECPTCKGRGFILHDEPTVSASYDDPYALKGGDPFIKTNKHNHGTPAPKEDPAMPQGSTPDVKAKLAAIAAAAQAAAGEDK